MIYHTDGEDVVTEYIFECYRRLYASAHNIDNYIIPFDDLYHAAMDRYKRTHIKQGFFYDYCCPFNIQEEIIEKTVNEPYVTIRGKYHKLKKFEMDRVKGSVHLGAAPDSNYENFLFTHKKQK